MRCCSGRWSIRKRRRSGSPTTSRAINWASQTALRDIIGKTVLADMLEGREKISGELQSVIDARTEPWGVNVISVELKDVLIPAALQDAMSMQAQAERERQARVILGDSERQIAEKFNEAAKSYADNPTAFHLRAMNMLYEGLKRNNATIVIVPSTAVETMQLGGVAGLTALAKGVADGKPAPEPQPPPPVAAVRPADTLSGRSAYPHRPNLRRAPPRRAALPPQGGKGWARRLTAPSGCPRPSSWRRRTASWCCRGRRARSRRRRSPSPCRA